MAEPEEVWVTLARVVRPQGRRGEVLADLFTDSPSQFATAPALSLRAPAGTRKPVSVEDHWMPTGRSAGRVVLKIAGVESITDAEALTGMEVQLLANERVELDELTHYVSDLTGCTMIDNGTSIGTVEDVHFPVDAEGRRLHDAAPLFVVRRSNGDDLLIPFANAFVQSIDVTAKEIQMNLPGGLLELNG